MGRWLWLLGGGALLLGACRFDSLGFPAGQADGGGNGGPDAAAADGPIGAPDAQRTIDSGAPDANLPDATPACDWGWSPVNFDPCDPALPAPTTGLTLPAEAAWVATFYDTDTGILYWPDGSTTTPPSVLLPQPGGPTMRVLELTDLTIGTYADLRALGSHPLLIAVYGDATVAGAIDVSAIYYLDMVGTAHSLPGAGGDDATLCVPSWGDPGTDATDFAAGAGGGGGGGYGGNGGDGGDGGNGGNGGQGSKGGKGSKNSEAMISPLRGGCGGGAGGDPSLSPATGGWAGHGGGGLDLAVRGSLTLTGYAISRGEEGHAATAGHGAGGGGGSGGAILLEADVITIGAAAAVCANGGSGGEGSGQTTVGASGQPGTCSAIAGAVTADTSTRGGNGGGGGYAGMENAGNASNGSDGGGGGGGGGGVGRVRFVGVSSETVSPTAVISPAAAP